MADTEILELLATQHSGYRIDMETSKDPNIVKRYKNSLDIIGGETCWLFDNIQGINEIIAKINMLATQGLGMVVIDYLQLVRATNPRADTKDQISSITRALKLLCQKLKIPIFILSQPSREQTRENSYPKLSDLRDSSSIESDSDRVIFLYRPNEDTLGDSQRKDDDMNHVAPRRTFDHKVIQAKNRKGKRDVWQWSEFTGETQLLAPKKIEREYASN